ncbi:MAG: helix-turn-helix domain-containing protein [Ruminococcaceae bacterium]|nr:helix-turn-helix domain-containing protein [Oscillospiraceae bacterium]
MNDYKFGNFLCMLREKKGMTQAEIANKLGVTAAAVSKWENGSAKPRVDVLLQLSKILDVRVEELMSGEYIEADALDTETVKTINERYEYLVKVDLYNTMEVKIRRLIAAIIDWNVIGFSTLVLISLYMGLFNKAIQQNSTPATLGVLFVMLLYPIGFVLRDIIFGHRSLGKKITGLTILDQKSGQPAGFIKRVVRNLFLPFMQFDVIIMLIIGRSIGDSVAQTLVVPQKISKPKIITAKSNIKQTEVEKINSYAPPKSKSIKTTIIIFVCAFIAFIIFIVSTVMVAISFTRDSEEYKLAYSYFVESDTFKSLNVDESKIFNNSYSSEWEYSNDGNYDLKTTKISFTVKFRTYTVVCHYKNEVWTVCEECTRFK